MADPVLEVVVKVKDEFTAGFSKITAQIDAAAKKINTNFAPVLHSMAEMKKSFASTATEAGKLGTATEKAMARAKTHTTGFMVELKRLSHSLFSIKNLMITWGFNIFVKGLTETIGKTEDLGRAFENIAKAKGLDPTKVLDAMRTGMRGTISDMELMKYANIMMGQGIAKTEEDFYKLANGARVLGKAYGRDLPESMERLTYGISRMSNNRLEELGLNMKISQAYDTYAAKLGKTADKLTMLQKKEAFKGAVMKKMTEDIASMGEDQLSSSEKFAQAAVSAGDAWRKFADGMKPFLLDIVQTVTKALQDNAGTFQNLGAVIGQFVTVTLPPLLKTISNILEVWSKIADAATRAGTAMAGATPADLKVREEWGKKLAEFRGYAPSLYKGMSPDALKYVRDEMAKEYDKLINPGGEPLIDLFDLYEDRPKRSQAEYEAITEYFQGKRAIIERYIEEAGKTAKVIERADDEYQDVIAAFREHGSMVSPEAWGAQNEQTNWWMSKIRGAQGLMQQGINFGYDYEHGSQKQYVKEWLALEAEKNRERLRAEREFQSEKEELMKQADRANAQWQYELWKDQQKVYEQIEEEMASAAAKRSREEQDAILRSKEELLSRMADIQGTSRDFLMQTPGGIAGFLQYEDEQKRNDRLLQNSRVMLGYYEKEMGTIPAMWKAAGIGIDSYINQLGTVANITAQTMEGMLGSMETTFGDVFFDAMTNKIQNFRVYMRSFLQDITRMLAQMMAKMAMMGLIQAGVGALGGLLGGAAAPLGNSNAALAGAPSSSILSGGIPTHAAGGLFTRPHIGVVGDVPEAVIPLRNGKVPVETVGASVGASSKPVTVNFNITTNDASSFQRSLVDNKRIIEGIIKSAIRDDRDMRGTLRKV